MVSFLEPAASSVAEQRLFCKITGPNNHSVADLDDCGKHKLLSKEEVKKGSFTVKDLLADSFEI